MLALLQWMKLFSGRQLLPSARSRAMMGRMVPEVGSREAPLALLLNHLRQPPSLGKGAE